MCIHIKTENFKNSILMQYLYNNNDYFLFYSCMQIVLKYN